MKKGKIVLEAAVFAFIIFVILLLSSMKLIFAIILSILIFILIYIRRVISNTVKKSMRDERRM